MTDTNELLPANTYTDTTSDTDVTQVTGEVETATVQDVSPVSTGPRHAVETVDQVAATTASYDDSADGKGYTPTFNNTVRTIIYVVGLVATAVGLGFVQFGDAGIGAYISTTAGLITGGFGVAYNPIRMAGK
jgi:hypothetical protein